uniref:Inositol polyphosphate-5-phosphatase J n=1 Tax=Varanus komodoensis TaxID=61221 RepID=A0A8D2JBA3_VARKO
IAKSSWPILKGFQEGSLNFPPTFKFDVGTNMYDTSAKKRKPAWTDRILWKIKGSGAVTHPGRSSCGVLAVTQLCYCSHMEYTVSDHKPVVSIFAVQFASRAEVPLVELQVADEWTKTEQAVVRYKISSAYHRSSWDWIALYRLMFPEESLPKGKGDYILGYYSNNCNCMVGVTEPFQISLPTSERASSPTDSSSSSEEDDDSTLVLLGPKSRSPSPGKMKPQRSRSPSLAMFQELITRSSSRDQGASRSPSPKGRRASREPAPGRESGAGPRGPAGWCFDESGVGRADPRSLGLLPAVRLETLDQALSHRRESSDQGPPSRRMSPTSPTAGLSALFGTSPQEAAPQDPHGPSTHGRDAGL